MPLVTSLEKSVVRQLRTAPAVKPLAKSAARAIERDALSVATTTGRVAAKAAGYTPAPVTKAIGRIMMNAGHTMARVSFEVTRPLLGDTGGRLVSMATSGPVYLVGTGLTLAVAGGAELWKRVSRLVGRAR
jgi:hypothetical protein